MLCEVVWYDIDKKYFTRTDKKQYYEFGMSQLGDFKTAQTTIVGKAETK